MDNYPCNRDQTMAMLFLAALPEGSKILNLGGRDSQLLISRSGYQAQNIRRGQDILSCDFPEGSFDGIISQGEMGDTGDMNAAILKAGKLLRKGGFLMMSELCTDPWNEALDEAGFRTSSCEDISNMWKAWYMERIFAGLDAPEWLEKPFKYYTMICQKL